MNLQVPPPLEQAPPPRGFWKDFRLLAATQLRLTWNKIRHWPLRIWLLILLPSLAFLALLIFLSTLAHGALESAPPEIATSILGMSFMVGIAAQMFFGITAAFAALYMSEDLEILFVAPVSTRAVFAVKTLVVATSNLLAAGVFIFLPGLFYGLLFNVSLSYYLWLVLVSLGLLALGTALAELLNMVVMRVVPPHRSKEAVGFIGALSGILIALIFQLPAILVSQNQDLDMTDWLANQEMLSMDFLPWTWGARALVESATNHWLPALGWTLLVIALGAGIFSISFLLVERGFRRGWVSLSQGGGGRRRKRTQKNAAPSQPSVSRALPALNWETQELASPLQGMWAVAKKDLLYMKRDTREWFGYLTPLLLMAFFIARAIFLPGNGAESSLVTVLVMYTIMFSGNMALQSFGREGESSWLLNSVPLAGWPVVWGKLIGSVLPTLILMEALLTGTGLAIGLPANILVAMVIGAILISLGSSSIGLFYSINHCRYNPDKPQQRISGGAAFLMYVVNMLFIALLAICLAYTFPPEELLSFVQTLPRAQFAWGFTDILLYLLSLLIAPLRWPAAPRIILGLLATLGVWAAVFLGFMKLTVNQTLKGFRVELVTRKK